MADPRIDEARHAKNVYRVRLQALQQALEEETKTLQRRAGCHAEIASDSASRAFATAYEEAADRLTEILEQSRKREER